MNVLTLIDEFSRLDEARTRTRGRLAPAAETRWRRLKLLYDRIMTQEPPAENPDAHTVAVDDVREQVKNRGRLRVRKEMPAFFQYQDTLVPSRLINVSRGGVFLGSKVLLSQGVEITVFLPNLRGDYQDLFETRGVVVWNTKGVPQSGLPRGMGVRFFEMGRLAEEQLDSLIVESLHERLFKC